MFNDIKEAFQEICDDAIEDFEQEKQKIEQEKQEIENYLNNSPGGHMDIRVINFAYRFCNFFLSFWKSVRPKNQKS